MLVEKSSDLLRLKWLILLVLGVFPAAAQFNVAGYPIQVHGFVSQGFAYSNVNNYLTMDTSKGSFAFTDAGLNVSSQITDKFRVGAQGYVRDIGNLGRGHVTLDWASGDYRFNDWIGVRAGKVKTPLGLYNETQDMEFLHTWAILPQAVYPLDLRETSLAHLGADVYGSIPIHKFGQLSYSAYAGTVSQDLAGGYDIGLAAENMNSRKITGSARGADLKWTTPLTGLLLSASYLHTPQNAVGINEQFGTPTRVHVFGDQRMVFSGQYTRGNLRLEAEYNRELQKVDLFAVLGPFGPPLLRTNFDRRAWYVAVAYRVSKHLEVGTYNSRFFPNANRGDWAGPGILPNDARHIFDQTVTARIDVTKFWDFKVEGHFIDGYGDPTSFRGFYPQDNPTGLRPRTNLLVLRTGVNF